LAACVSVLTTKVHRSWFNSFYSMDFENLTEALVKGCHGAVLNSVHCRSDVTFKSFARKAHNL
jgi:hypothetical protein